MESYIIFTDKVLTMTEQGNNKKNKKKKVRDFYD